MAPLATPAEMAAAWGVPGLTMATLHDMRPRRDTPADTMANLDLPRVLDQLAAVDEAVRRAVYDAAGFVAGGAPVRRTHRVEGQVLGLAPGKPVPDLPRPGFYAVMYQGKERKPTLNYDWRARFTLGVRRTEVRATDAEGRYEFDGLDQLGNRDLRYRVIQVYRVEPGTGAVVAASDNGRVGSDFKSEVDLDRGTIRPVKSQTFECDEFALVGLYDPRFLQDLGTVLPRDARRNAEPQRSHLLIHGGVMAGFVEPGSKNYFLFRYGQIGNRLALLNVPGPDEAGAAADRLARGYSAAEFNDLGPPSLVSAADFWNLDDRRLRSYAAAGVSSPLLDDLHAAAGEGIEAARAALEADDAAGFTRNATGAWATEALVYSAAQAMANDVVRAAIFLLLLCVPFAFCMERLLFATPSVYRQIGYALGIFVFMVASLWAFHPAFRITNSALIIILAFAILFMSGLVIWVVYSRFDTELKKVRRGTAADSSSAASNSFARASVIGQAVMLGVANMRRRRFRTFLTAATIVLITFAVLAFTSSTTYTSTTRLPTGEQAEYPGLMMRQRGFRVVPEQLLDGVRAVGDAEFPGRQVVPRYWNLADGDEQFLLYLAVEGEDVGGGVTVVQQRGAVGISPGESRLTPLERVVGVAAAARLQEPGAAVIALAEPTAAALGAAVGDTVRVGGLALELAGVFDPDAYDSQMTSISGEPVAPLDVSSGLLDAGGRRLTDANAETLSLGGNESAAEADAAYQHLSAVNFFLVPADVSRRLPQAGLRSVSVRFENEAELEAAVNDLTRRYALATFAAYDDGVKLVSASQPTSVAGTAVVVPLLIGGLIIFNTMMGSIAERAQGDPRLHEPRARAVARRGAVRRRGVDLRADRGGLRVRRGAARRDAADAARLAGRGDAELQRHERDADDGPDPAGRAAVGARAGAGCEQDRGPEHRPDVAGARADGRRDPGAAAVHDQRDGRRGRAGVPGRPLRRPPRRDDRQVQRGRHRAVHLRPRRAPVQRAAGERLADALRPGRPPAGRGRHRPRRHRGRLRGRRRARTPERRRRRLVPHEPLVPDRPPPAVPRLADAVAEPDAGLRGEVEGDVRDRKRSQESGAWSQSEAGDGGGRMILFRPQTPSSS